MTQTLISTLATNRSLYFNVAMKRIIISRAVFSKGHFQFRVLNVRCWRLRLDDRTTDDVTCRTLWAACRCASVSLRPLTCDDMKGHRWGPWEQRCIRVFAEDEKIPKHESIPTIQTEFDCRTSRPGFRNTRMRSAARFSRGGQLLLASFVCWTLTRYNKEGSRRFVTPTWDSPGNPNLAWTSPHSLLSLLPLLYCPANTKLFSSGRSNFFNIDADCISWLPISNKEFKEFNLLINHLEENAAAVQKNMLLVE